MQTTSHFLPPNTISPPNGDRQSKLEFAAVAKQN
jgi:hypothetical protein